VAKLGQQYAAGGPGCIPPTITVQPFDTSVCTNATTNLTVTVIGTGPLTFKWWQNGVDMSSFCLAPFSGCATATLTISNPPITSDGHTFFATVNNACGSVTSSVVTLHVSDCAGGGGGVALTNAANLVGFWKLNESGGSRADSSTQGNTLTDHGTVTNHPGKISNSATFIVGGPNQYLDHASNTSLAPSSGVSMTVWCWVNWDGSGSRRFFVGKADAGPASVDYGFDYDNSGHTYRFFWDTTACPATTHGDPAPDNALWVLLVGWYNASDHTIHIRVNNEADDSVPHTGFINSGGAFAIGRLGSCDCLYAQADIDAVGISKVAPVTADLNWIWNGGAGQEMP